MKLIQELLGLHPQKLTEAKSDLYDLIEKYIDQEKMYSFEGGRGVNHFEKIIRVIGYRDMDNFLEDNSGCLQAMVDWLMEQKSEEWEESMRAELPAEEVKVDESVDLTEAESKSMQAWIDKLPKPVWVVVNKDGDGAAFNKNHVFLSADNAFRKVLPKTCVGEYKLNTEKGTVCEPKSYHPSVPCVKTTKYYVGWSPK